MNWQNNNSKIEFHGIFIISLSTLNVFQYKRNIPSFDGFASKYDLAK
jgi:hypothetical protein